MIVCGREDLNLHGFDPIASSRLRVYQFRHVRIISILLHFPLKIYIKNKKSPKLMCKILATFPYFVL